MYIAFSNAFTQTSSTIKNTYFLLHTFTPQNQARYMYISFYNYIQYSTHVVSNSQIQDLLKSIFLEMYFDLKEGQKIIHKKTNRKSRDRVALFVSLLHHNLNTYLQVWSEVFIWLKALYPLSILHE